MIACVREAVDMNQDIKICGYLHNWWVFGFILGNYDWIHNVNLFHYDMFFVYPMRYDTYALRWVENSSVVSCLKSKGREKEKAEKDTKSTMLY